MPQSPLPPIRAFTPEDLAAHLPAFAALLADCVAAGASVGFVMPLAPEETLAFWRDKVLPGLRRGGLVLLAIEQEGAILGTVQLDCDTPANQPHRAEIRKLLVHPAQRRRGLARALMAAAEEAARARGRTLLTLDTRTGDAAEPLYLSMGYIACGIIPDYCRDTLSPRLDSTTILYRRLER